MMMEPEIMESTANAMDSHNLAAGALLRISQAVRKAFRPS
jgi:hypothetical protein